MTRLLVLSALCISVVPLSATPSARQAIVRAIPFIEEQGVDWIEKRNCVSCHRINTMVWSLNLAREKGFVVSEELDKWIDWSITASFSKNDKGKIVGQLNKEGVAQLLVGLPQLSKAKRAKLAALLPHDQRKDGTWKPGGQLPGQKRPIAETSIVTAQWLVLALADGPAAVRARKAARNSPAGQSTEYYALKLLLADTLKARSAAQQALLQHQSDDGGWGWLTQGPSDALGTGLALYALQRAGLSPEAKTAVQARAFLLRTQMKDGSWPVRGTKANKKKSVEETATYWGTTWAVIALATGLPAKGE